MRATGQARWTLVASRLRRRSIIEENPMNGQVMNTTRVLDTFTDAYVTCALWSETGDDEEPLDSEHSIDDIDSRSLLSMQQDCDKFRTDNRDDINELDDDSQASHDFWLSRNGHGAGFWDRGNGDLGERLTKASQMFKTCNLYIGDDRRIHVA